VSADATQVKVTPVPDPATSADDAVGADGIEYAVKLTAAELVVVKRSVSIAVT
jgi:hypothetical protein